MDSALWDMVEPYSEGYCHRFHIYTLFPVIGWETHGIFLLCKKGESKVNVKKVYID